MIEHLAKLPLDRAEDVFALRQGGRVAAAFVGCDEADQVRFATALSELGREALVHGAGASAGFALEDDGSLRVDIQGFPRSSGRAAKIVGLEAARKLIDGVSVVDGSDTATVTVTISRRVASQTSVSAAKLRSELRRNVALRPLDELRLENRDLVATLSELRAQQEQLMHLNAELEDTNRGVMAMYAQLADELEETNRGVVALYAELDDKTVRLNEASEAKTRFLASVSHELRSPVNSILGLVRLLTEPDGGDALSDEQRKQLALVRSSGSELLRLVNGLLDLAKAESGRLDPEVAPVDLATHFAELRGSLRPLARPGVKLEVDVPDVPLLETDGVLLGQVLRNLLTNALKFTAHGSVRLAARSSAPHEIEISVTDTGVGIAAVDQAKVFEEFYQVRGPLQADHKGTGLGLPYARRVTQTLGGDMSLESEPGRGSIFTIRLPTRWQPLLRAPESPGTPSTAPVSVERILIVDDDEGFRTALRGMLQGTAAHIAEARGGIEGLAMMRERAPDLAFVDLWMPDLDGANVLGLMGADDDLRSIPVVIVTSAQLTESVRTSLGRAVTVLSKANVTRGIVHDVIVDALRIAPTTA